MDADGITFSAGLICDTKDQAERFVTLLGDNVERAIETVNREAGTPNACLVATTGFIRGGTVPRYCAMARVIDVVEVTVMAVATKWACRRSSRKNTSRSFAPAIASPKGAPL